MEEGHLGGELPQPPRIYELILNRPLTAEEIDAKDYHFIVPSISEALGRLKYLSGVYNVVPMDVAGQKGVVITGPDILFLVLREEETTD